MVPAARGLGRRVGRNLTDCLQVTTAGVTFAVISVCGMLAFRCGGAAGLHANGLCACACAAPRVFMVLFPYSASFLVVIVRAALHYADLRHCKQGNSKGYECWTGHHEDTSTQGSAFTASPCLTSVAPAQGRPWEIGASWKASRA